MNQATADGDTRRGRTTTVWLIIPVVAVAAGSASAVRVLTVDWDNVTNCSRGPLKDEAEHAAVR
jgi:hypothetical protein